MMAFVRFAYELLNMLKNRVFSKVPKIGLKFSFIKVLDYSCAHVLRKGSSKWALD
jgi:hypothetical protein